MPAHPWRCAVTPRFEAFFALWSLTSSAARRHSSWRARTRARLSPAFWAAHERTGNSAELWILMSDLPGILPPRSPMEAVLDRLQAMPPEPFKRKLLEAALHDSTTVDAVMGGQALAAALKAIPRA